MDILQACIGLTQIALMWWFGRKQMPRVQAADTANPEMQRPIRFQYLPLVGMVVLVIAAWIPYFLRLGEPRPVMAMTFWTASKDGCDVGVDGAKLMNFAGKYMLLWLAGFLPQK